MKITGHVAALALLMTIQSQSAIAESDQEMEFNIPAQNLSSALSVFFKIVVA